MNHTGSCHCGDLKFSFEAEIEQVLVCNCSYCRRKGSMLTFLPKSEVLLEMPKEAYSTYLFNKHMINHHFCNTCGCAPFSIGTSPDGVEMVAINVNCLDEPLDLGQVKRVDYDGKSA